MPEDFQRLGPPGRTRASAHSTAAGAFLTARGPLDPLWSWTWERETLISAKDLERKDLLGGPQQFLQVATDQEAGWR